MLKGDDLLLLVLVVVLLLWSESVFSGGAVVFLGDFEVDGVGGALLVEVRSLERGREGRLMLFAFLGCEEVMGVEWKGKGGDEWGSYTGGY